MPTPSFLGREDCLVDALGGASHWVLSGHVIVVIGAWLLAGGAGVVHVITMGAAVVPICVSLDWVRGPCRH